jgi:hypothetical protein
LAVDWWAAGRHGQFTVELTASGEHHIGEIQVVNVVP